MWMLLAIAAGTLVGFVLSPGANLRLKQADCENDAEKLIQARLSLAADWLPLSIPHR
jgi:Na+/H+-dicarboxylate symporter